MTKLDAKKAFYILRKIYIAAKTLGPRALGDAPSVGEYRFFWTEPRPIVEKIKELPNKWSFEISCRISGQSLWDGHIEEYHLHDVIGAQYKCNDDNETYQWLQWETRFPLSSHEYYLNELNSWASDALDR